MVDKKEKTQNIKQYHIDLKPGDIGKYVLLPGDPDRSDRVAKYLDNPKKMAEKREHRTYTGYYKDVKVSVTSTGMGCPSASIAAEELINIGAECLIRIGSTAALQEGPTIGDLIISTGSMKNEGTSKFYVPDRFPAIPDFELTKTIIDTADEYADELGYEYYYGINATDDAFYGETEEWINKLSELGCLNVEMESSAIYTVCHKRNKRAAMISAVSANLITEELVYEGKNEGLITGWENEIKVVLEAIKSFDDNNLNN